MEYVGKRYVFSYPSGLEVEAFYPTADSVNWRALTGPAPGTSGVERTHVVQLTSRRFFISWVESDGTTVSNVIDLDAMKVAAFVTWQSGEARQGQAEMGTVTEVAESERAPRG
jgi:phenolic acid decarboxylase